MKKETNEFSFILKPSKIPNAGVGIFALHDIAKDTRLRVFGDQIEDDVDRARLFEERDVPTELLSYCVHKENNVVACPNDFGKMEVGWYMNHSTNPNVRREKEKWFFAIRDIKNGEELLIDYNTLGDPKEAIEDYYRK